MAETLLFSLGGVYYGETISWTKTSREFKLKLTAYGDEKPVFEGEGNTVFLGWKWELESALM